MRHVAVLRRQEQGDRRRVNTHRPNARQRSMTSYVLTVSCKSTRGIVAAITGFLAEKGCNIHDSSQFDDLETGLFFMRLTFVSQEGATEEDLTAGFAPVAKTFGMTWQFHNSSERMKVLLMV